MFRAKLFGWGRPVVHANTGCIMDGEEREAEKMQVSLVYVVTFVVIVVSVFVSLFFKYMLEQLFNERKSVTVFHLCNLVIILWVSGGTYAVFTVFGLKEELTLVPAAAVFLAVIMPVYLLGHLAFETYKSIYFKYTTTEDEKLVVLNPKYLDKRKNARFREYNAAGREDKSRKHLNSRFKPRS